jgi:uncharacterized protein (TIGR02145 family)
MATQTKPIVITNPVSDIKAGTATCGGCNISNGGTKTLARGVCWSSKSKPTILDSKTNDGNSILGFTSHITGLKPNTTYTIRAYVTDFTGTYYGDIKTFTTLDGVIDNDGNVYNMVTIGNQVWMVENLKTTTFRNGDSIPNITKPLAWQISTKAAYCDYQNDVDYATFYGRIYNWHAVNDPHKIAPIGWRVPSDQDWKELVDYLNFPKFDNAGGKMKIISTTSPWNPPNEGATNSSGFSAVPGGMRGAIPKGEKGTLDDLSGNTTYDPGFFSQAGSAAFFWSNTDANNGRVWIRILQERNAQVTRTALFKEGYYVRCIKE